MAGHTPNSGKSASGDGKRKHRRRPQSTLESNFGPILDLSAAGTRVISSRALSGIVNVTISGRGIDHSLKARVAWSRKLGFRMYDVGLEFIDCGTARQIVGWIAVWSGRPAA